jgi:hypothetical protein
VRTLIVLAFGLVGLSRAQAQTTVAQPESLIIPNYDRIHVGRDEALEGGAYLARSAGASANAYNPAGVVAGTGSQVNASSTGYELITLKVAGVTRNASGTSIIGLGSYLGLTVAGLLPSDRWRLGFSISQPLDWEPPSLSTVLESTEGLPREEAQLDATGRLLAIVPAVAVGFAATPSLRFGAQLLVPRVSFDQHGAVVVRSATATANTVTIRAATASGVSDQVRLSAGAQWEVIPELSLGMVVTSPGAAWHTTGNLTAQGGTYTGTSQVDNVFRDEGASFAYRLPFQAGGGVALNLGRFALEADVRWYASVGEFSLFASDATGTRTMTDAAGAPTTSTVTFQSSRVRWRDVVNFAVGGHFDVWQSLRLHAGFTVDQSPVETGSAVFPKVGKMVSGSVGLTYTAGTSDRSIVGTLPGGMPIESVVKLGILQLLYSIQFDFAE